MQFLDEAKIFIKSGNGGAGCVSFRREANVPFGGPDGGDGGKAGDIICRTVEGLSTLIDYRYQQHFKSRSGGHGMGRNRTGAASGNVYLDVPIGTQIFTEDGDALIADMDELGKKVVLASGGKGGLGNVNFKSSVNQAPRKALPGHPGEEAWIWLKLKLISDVGIIGFPNAGKSTLLSRVSRARPKIADYPFTTLQPNLGVVYVDGKEFVMADIPGLIEGAHQGTGLGIKFLKHIERCNVVLHVIDGTEEDLLSRYKIIRKELESYSEILSEKEEILVVNKIDSMEGVEVKQLEDYTNKKVYLISAVSGENVTNVIRELAKIIGRKPKKEEKYSPI